jgi:hypothetical protein
VLVACDLDSLVGVLSSARVGWLYARNTGMYACKNLVTDTASDISLSTAHVGYGRQRTDTASAVLYI